MNRINFNGGGQPIFLDDFQLLQDNQDEIIGTLIRALCGDENIILCGCEVEHESMNEGMYKVIVKAGKAFMGGDIVEWKEPLEIVVSSETETELYLTVEEQHEDLRDFSDGNQRYCRTIKTVRICENPEDGVEKINLSNVNTCRFPDALKKVLNIGDSEDWKSAKVSSFKNGFRGGASYRFNGMQTYVQIWLTSTYAAWNDTEGLVLQWDDTEELSSRLVGKFSTAVLFDTDVDGSLRTHNCVIEWSRDGHYLFLHPSFSGDSFMPKGNIDGFFIL